MKAKYILSSLLLAGCTFFSSCEDNLDISQHGGEEQKLVVQWVRRPTTKMCLGI